MNTFIKFTSLPPELIILVSNHLSVQDLCNLSATSRRINHLLRPCLQQAGKLYALASPADYEKWAALAAEVAGGRRARQEKHPIEPLVTCIVDGRYESVRKFLEFGVDPNAYTVTGVRMLKCALYHFRFDIAELLLEFGADPCLGDVGQRDSAVPLGAAATAGSDEMVKRLIEAGADVTGPGVMHAVAENCALEIVKMVVEKGADIWELEEGGTVLHSAVRNSDHRVTEYLLGLGLKEVASARKPNGETALWNACYAQNPKTIQLLFDARIVLTARDRWGGTAVHQAALSRQTEAIRYMLRSGVRINLAGENRDAELHYAVNGGDLEIIQLLIHYGAWINWTNRFGETPLHLAAMYDRGDIVKQLCTSGADPTIRNHHGRTPIDLAAERCYEDSVRCMQYSWQARTSL
ncbi:hypothetical protein DTO271G3_6240 [Paecilomyces variotii]|nr:hypothetical protein DTO271G3_6240 [Paecilomyces variotii]